MEMEYVNSKGKVRLNEFITVQVYGDDVVSESFCDSIPSYRVGKSTRRFNIFGQFFEKYISRNFEIYESVCRLNAGFIATCEGSPDDGRCALKSVVYDIRPTLDFILKSAAFGCGLTDELPMIPIASFKYRSDLYCGYLMKFGTVLQNSKKISTKYLDMIVDLSKNNLEFLYN